MRRIGEPEVEILSHNSVAVLAFAPDVAYPRLTRAVLAELHQQLDTLAHADCFRGVVIAANPQSFATGADIGEVAALDGIAACQFAATGQALFLYIERFPLPVVAAIRGFCLGGGLGLALACHARVATYDSSFGHPGPTLDVMTGWGGTGRLQRLVGKAAAMQIMLTGERIPATQALTLDLVNELVSSQDLIEAAARRARHMQILRSTTGDLKITG